LPGYIIFADPLRRLLLLAWLKILKKGILDKHVGAG
jgi:hypothetical protein